ncbi:MAG: hypothetical protein L0241_26250 [Planctomycetia bacterium]|nr:hypothetical protein [Planctomycetia bacterium]
MARPRDVEGWVNDRERPKPHADAAAVVEFLADGKKASVHNIYYPKGVVKKGTDSGEYRAYEGAVSFTAWLVWDETKSASMSVRVRVVATDGKTRLKESVVTGE